MKYRILWIAGLSSIIAVAAAALLFAMVDPVDIRILARLLGVSRMGLHVVSVVAFWSLVFGLSALFYVSRRALDPPDSNHGLGKTD